MGLETIESWGHGGSLVSKYRINLSVKERDCLCMTLKTTFITGLFVNGQELGHSTVKTTVFDSKCLDYRVMKNSQNTKSQPSIHH
jgi:hypothetical protein